MLILHLLRASPTKAKAVKARSNYVIDFLIYVAVCSFYRVNNHSKQFERKSKDRPTRTPNVVFCCCVALSEPSNYSFALTSMSLRDLPLL